MLQVVDRRPAFLSFLFDMLSVFVFLCCVFFHASQAFLRAPLSVQLPAVYSEELRWHGLLDSMLSQSAAAAWAVAVSSASSSACVPVSLL